MSSAETIRYIWETPPEVGQPFAVSDGIEWLRLPLPMKLDHVNCYILTEPDGSVTVVDTGFDSNKTRTLWQQALGGRRVSRVLVTHHHPDHVGLAGWFIAEHGASLLMTRTAYLMTRMLLLDEQDRPNAETVAFWRASGMDPQVLDQRLDERPFNFADVVHPLPLGFTRLSEHQMIQIGGRWWHVRMGNGHAPEHATLWEENGPFVLGGDQLLPSISPNLGLYATEPEGDPVGDFLISCESFADYATSEHLILPGHKLPFRGLPLRLRQLQENHEGALDRLRAHLATAHSAGECFQPIFKRQIRGAEYGLALVEAVAHCMHLFHLGEAERHLDDAGTWRFVMRRDTTATPA